MHGRPRNAWCGCAQGPSRQNWPVKISHLVTGSAATYLKGKSKDLNALGSALTILLLRYILFCALFFNLFQLYVRSVAYISHTWWVRRFVVVCYSRQRSCRWLSIRACHSICTGRVQANQDPTLAQAHVGGGVNLTLPIYNLDLRG